MAKTKTKKGVSKRLLDMCVGSDLEKQRLADRVDEACKVEAVVREKDGLEMEAGKWLNLHKKNLKA